MKIRNLKWKLEKNKTVLRPYDFVRAKVVIT